MLDNQIMLNPPSGFSPRRRQAPTLQPSKPELVPGGGRFQISSGSRTDFCMASHAHSKSIATRNQLYGDARHKDRSKNNPSILPIPPIGDHQGGLASKRMNRTSPNKHDRQGHLPSLPTVRHKFCSQGPQMSQALS